MVTNAKTALQQAMVAGELYTVQDLQEATGYDQAAINKALTIMVAQGTAVRMALTDEPGVRHSRYIYERIR